MAPEAITAPEVIVAAWPARKNALDNPFQAELSNGLVSAGVAVVEFDPLRSWRQSPRIWHWHWPENQLVGGRVSSRVARGVLLMINLLAARLRGIKLVLTIHNVTPHRVGGRVGQRLLDVVRRSASGLHFLSLSSQAEFVRLNPWAADVPSSVTAHGRYTLAPARVDGPASARESFGLDANVHTLAFIGQIDDYKRVNELAELVASMEGTAQLLILGRMSPECSYADALRQSAHRHENVVFVEGWAPEVTVATALEAADLVALPYRTVTNSGAAILALGAMRPVLVPRLGSLPEVADVVGGDWVHLYDELTSRAVSAALQQSHAQTDPPDLTTFSWAHIARQVAGLYGRVSLGYEGKADG